MADRSEKLWSALRKTTQRAASTSSMLSSLFGSTGRGRPDTKAAARALGVSVRTVQRWIKNGLPARSSAAADQLRAQHQQWQTGPGGRRAALSKRREARLRNKGTTFVFYGTISISGDVRTRGTTIPVDGDRMSPILDAALAGDDALALRRLEDAFAHDFGGSVTLPKIDELDTFG